MSDTIRITGGKPLTGEVGVRGAKNFVSKAMVAALLGDGPSTLHNVPDVRDVGVVGGLLELHGAKVKYDAPSGVLTIDPTKVAPASLGDVSVHAGSSRIPILFCGPILHRLGEAVIPDLGGCMIGDRPVDFHLAILKKFGAVVEELGDGIRLTAPDGLHGIRYKLK